MDIASAMNYMYLNEVDINPGGDSPEYAWVGPGISNFSPDKSETVEKEYLYDKLGDADTQVTGLEKDINVEGKRRLNDPFQNWAADREDATGDELCTTLRRTFPDGKVVECPVTIHEIKADQDGAPNEKAKFSCKISFNGSPETVVEPVGIAFPEKITATAVTVTVGETSDISATVTPEDANPRCVFATANHKVAAVTPDGTVTGVAAGETYVTARCLSKPSVMTRVKVTVSAASQAAMAKAAAKTASTDSK